MGGFVGNALGGTYVSSYWNTTTSTKNNSTGNGLTPAGITAKDSTQMLQQCTYSGWDYTSIIWKIVENTVSPFLNLQTVPGAPTNVVATRGNTSATITFDTPSDGGSAITFYTVTSSGGQTATGIGS